MESTEHQRPCLGSGKPTQSRDFYSKFLSRRAAQTGHLSDGPVLYLDLSLTPSPNIHMGHHSSAARGLTWKHAMFISELLKLQTGRFLTWKNWFD